MARPRQELQTLLEETLGSSNVYFQPPPSVQMSFPAIVYNRDLADNRFADNKLYRYVKRYQVTVIDPDPDSEIPDRIANLPMCSHQRFFATANLNHDVFALYF